jgi:hypothetical protein
MGFLKNRCNNDDGFSVYVRDPEFYAKRTAIALRSQSSEVRPFS